MTTPVLMHRNRVIPAVDVIYSEDRREVTLVYPVLAELPALSTMVKQLAKAGWRMTRYGWTAGAQTVEAVRDENM